MLILPETRRVEDEELGLGTKECSVRDPGAREVVLGLLGDVAGITRVVLARHRIAHEAIQDERPVLTERIDHRGVRIRNEQHVGLVDGLKPADRRAVEAEALVEHVLGELVGRDREMLHEPGQVAEP